MLDPFLEAMLVESPFFVLIILIGFYYKRKERKRRAEKYKDFWT